MTTYLPEELQERLHAARRAGLKKKSRLRVQADGASYPVLRLSRNGFAVEDETTPPLRGLVELLEGARPIYQCLVIAAAAEDGEMRGAPDAKVRTGPAAGCPCPPGRVIAGRRKPPAAGRRLPRSAGAAWRC